METRLLDDKNFHDTFGRSMLNVTGNELFNTVDIWSYVEVIPNIDLLPFSIEGQDVEYVYRTEDLRYDHVLIPTRTANVYLAIVVNLVESRVVGHHILNLNEKYGLKTPAN